MRVNKTKVQKVQSRIIANCVNSNRFLSNFFHIQKKALEMLNGTKDFLKKQIMEGGILSELENTTSLSFIQGIGNLLQSFSYAIQTAPGMDEFNRLRVS